MSEQAYDLVLAQGGDVLPVEEDSLLGQRNEILTERSTSVSPKQTILHLIQQDKVLFLDSELCHNDQGHAGARWGGKGE